MKNLTGPTLSQIDPLVICIGVNKKRTNKFPWLENFLKLPFIFLNGPY